MRILRRWPVPTADRPSPARSLHVDDAAAGEMAFKRARYFLFDLRPGGVGDGGELTMKIIHVEFLLLGNRYRAIRLSAEGRMERV